jgi:hypothetical protein
MEKLTAGWRKLCNVELRNLYSLPDNLFAVGIATGYGLDD